jgi:hypothetical protein
MTGANVLAAFVPTREEATRAATEALAAFDCADIFTVLQTVSALAQTLRELLAAVTTPTPPADDVREALALTIAKAFPGWSEDTTQPPHVGWSEALRLHAEQHNERVNEECLHQGRAYADAILGNRALEVRPRGPVTDAAVEAAYQVIRRNWRITREDVRAALEAAREVRA